MIEEILKIGKDLETKWCRESFPQDSLEYLQNFKVHKLISDFEEEVSGWLGKENLPNQLNLYNNFGEPSLTIFNNGKFAIDIYFWRKNDTIIHSHGFRGAFKVIYGSSLHEEFNLKTEEVFSKDIIKTIPSKTDLKIMSPGDIQIITPSLTHRVVHLENPTVTLCLRTVEDLSLEQWHRFESGLSFKKKHLSEKLIKQILYFQYLLDSDESKAKKILSTIIKKLDNSTQISLYESLYFNELSLNEDSFYAIEEIFKNIFENKKWFYLYKSHYETLSKNLQDSKAGSKEAKLLIHSINNGYKRGVVEELLSKISDKNIDDLSLELKNNYELFSDEFKDEQLKKINSFN